MNHHASLGLIVSLAIPLFATGCKNGSGDGLAGFFGLGGSSSSEVLSTFSFLGAGDGGSAGGSSDGGGALGGLPSGGSQIAADQVATVHSPEPASLALFGGGLMGMAAWRRRKARKSSS